MYLLIDNYPLISHLSPDDPPRTEARQGKTNRGDYLVVYPSDSGGKDRISKTIVALHQPAVENRAAASTVEKTAINTPQSPVSPAFVSDLLAS